MQMVSAGPATLLNGIAAAFIQRWAFTSKKLTYNLVYNLLNLLHGCRGVDRLCSLGYHGNLSEVKLTLAEHNNLIRLKPHNTSNS